MGRCCGGKNAGKPISWSRYALGLGVFCAYHGAIGTLLHVAAVPWRDLRKVRDFHRQVARRELGEILRRVDINVNGPDPASQEACDVPAQVGPA
jgi:hypothetical protein